MSKAPDARLEPLLGTWVVEGAHPDGMAILGEGETGFAQHYFDSRGVARVYAMTLGPERWELSHLTYTRAA